MTFRCQVRDADGNVLALLNAHDACGATSNIAFGKCGNEHWQLNCMSYAYTRRQDNPDFCYHFEKWGGSLRDVLEWAKSVHEIPESAELWAVWGVSDQFERKLAEVGA